MKVKVLKIRLDEAFIHADQQLLDDFLACHQVFKFESAFVKQEECWSVILCYDELPASATIQVLRNGQPATPKDGGSNQSSVGEMKPVKYAAGKEEPLTADETKILDCLRLWRNRKAKEQKLPSYCIATNSELVSIAKYQPASADELRDIKGFGRHKIENFGAEIIEVLEMV